MKAFVRIFVLAAVATACMAPAAARQASPGNGAEDKHPSALTIIMSAAAMVNLELLEKYCSIAEPARAAAYRSKAQMRVQATDPGFLALVRSSEVYPPIVKKGQESFEAMDRPQLLERCAAFLQQD